MRSLTVLVVPRAYADEVVAVLVDYSAVGLVDPFVWVDGAALGGAATPAVLVRDGQSDGIVLQQLLTAERYDRIRVAVLVPTAAPDAARVPQAAEQAVEQTVRSSSMGARVGLVRMLLTTGADRPVTPDAALLLEGWHNLLGAPDDSAAPGLGAVPWGRLDDPLDVAQRVAPVVAGVTGLWAGLDGSPFDTLEILPGQTVRAVRAFYRRVDSSALETQLRAALFDPSGRLPLPRGGQVPVIYVEDVGTAARGMAEALWRKHRDVLRGPRVKPDDSGARAISVPAALRMFFSFLGAALRKAPGAWWSAVSGSVGSMVAAGVQGTVFGGRESAFEVVANVELADWQGLGSEAEALSIAIGGPQAEHLARADLSPLWNDFVSGALTLADGGRRAPELEPVAVGSAVGVLPNAADVVPTRSEMFAAIPTSLAAVIGVNAVEAADVLGVATVRDRLQRAYSDPAAGVEARTAGTELDNWERATQRSYAVQVSQILVEWMGKAKADVAREVSGIQAAAKWTSADEKLRARQQAVSVILKTMTWAVLGVLVLMFGFATVLDVFDVAPAFSWQDWQFILVSAAVLVVLYVLVALGLFTLAQRDLFAELNLRRTQLSQLEAMQANLRTALTDISRLSAAYGQLLAWCRVLGPLLRAPFGQAPPIRPPAAQLSDGLPRSTQVGVATPGTTARDDASHAIERRLYPLGWLTKPWQDMVVEAAGRLREDPEMLFRMPGTGSGSGLDRWSSAVASGQVQPTGADALWARVQEMFVDGSGIGDTLTRAVAVPTLGRDVDAAEFGAGFLDHRPGRAAPFDASLFTNSATTAGHSVVAVDVAAVARRGLGYRAAVIQASDGLPPYDFALFASGGPTGHVAGDDVTTKITRAERNVTPPGEDMVF